MLKKMVLSVAMLIACASGVVQAAETPLETLARSKNCFSCHAMDKKLVGPSFRDISAKYQSKNVEQLVAKVQKGGAGTWGPVPMPANPQVTAEEAKTLVTLIFAFK